MEIKEKIKIEKEEEIIKEAYCDFCQSKFENQIVSFQGYGIIKIGFGYGSDFDDDIFHLEICDSCFVKKFGSKLKKQFDEKGYLPEDIKEALLKKTSHKFAKENSE